MSKGKAPAAGAEQQSPPKKPAKTPDSSVQMAIGNRLRAYYDDVAKEPVPDRFLELLKQLGSKESGN